MSVTVRLPKATEIKLSQFSIREKKTKSKIIKESLELYFSRKEKIQSPFELGKKFFGKYGSGKGNLSVDAEKILREKFNEKNYT